MKPPSLFLPPPLPPPPVHPFRSSTTPHHHRTRPHARATPAPAPPPPPIAPACPVSQVSVLPLPVIQRIAAGEVIHSLTCAVAELVENALDASATAISVDVDARRGAVTVVDDGTGVSVAQGLRLVATCNATSKLRALAELRAGVTTLGFRGQALWALAVIAGGLRVASRTEGDVCGVQVQFDADGEVVDGSVTPVGMAVGTVVEVSGLPWRDAGRGVGRVVRECRAWLVRAALCHPRVSFRLLRGGVLCWRCAGAVGAVAGGARGDACLFLLARELKRSPAEFRQAAREVPGVGEVEVVIGLPSTVHSGSRSWVITAVNGRCVFVDSLTRAVVSMFNVRKGRFPAAFVSVSVRPELVDWNISPRKNRVGFSAHELETQVVESVREVIADLLQGFSGLQDAEAPEEFGTPLFSATKPQVLQNLLSLMPTSVEAQDDTDSNGVGSKADAFKTNLSLSVLPCNARVVAQVLQTYLLVEYSGGIMLVEQHVAEERVLYEKLVKQWKECSFLKLGEPVRLPGSTCDEWIFCLTSLGFDVEAVTDGVRDDADCTYVVHSVPQMMSEMRPNAMRAVLIRLCRQGATIEEAAAAVACKLATKNGSALGQAKMRWILSELLKCENGHTCPHGRPIVVELRTQDLAHLFGRSWSPERVDTSLQDTWSMGKMKRGTLQEEVG